MKHIHKYETISHQRISAALTELGIQSAEIRRCKTCHKEMTFLMTKKGEWVPLLDENESDKQDILLA